MTDTLKKHIKDFEEQAEKLAIAKEEVFDMKVDIVGSALGMLMKKLMESVDDWTKMNAEKNESAIELGTEIKTAIEKVIEAIVSQKPPTVNVPVSINMEPIRSIAADISVQNQSLVKLLTKLSGGDGGKMDQLHKLVVLMIEKQNAFLDRVFEKTDYTGALQSIAAGLKGEPEERVERLVAVRNEFREITELIPEYKTITRNVQ